ncbi:MAG: acetamidase/formamidase family protein [Nocardioides sp.]|uniref:acetamidase/formamidase family protein n=1 Tax=Nocardioides sp. TaxID=35761 RepID=UPI0039E5111F
MTLTDPVSVEFTLGREQCIFAFGPELRPAVTVGSGAVVRLMLNDCYHGQVTSEADLPSGIDESMINAATGPIEVREAQPGDTLVVDLLEINPGPRGAATVSAGRGQLQHLGLTDATRMFDVADGLVRMNERVAFPARPMVGVIGVATGGEVAPTLDAGPHGGNLDDNLHTVGTRVLLPVRQPGAMLAIGDMHAAMGDGEVGGSGVEIDGDVLIRVGIEPGRQTTWPAAVLDDHWVTHGTTVEDLTGAVDAACDEAGRLLVDQWGFTVEDAMVFLSVACDVGIAQAVHPCPGTVIARVKVPRIDACPLPFRPRT